MVRKHFLFTFAVLMVLGCGPRHPAQVPKESVWVRGQQQGAFILLGERAGSRWRVQVWSREGALLADRPFALRGMARTSIEPHELAAWDGRQIALKDGTLLVPAP
jgi:hypothetical protein